MRAKAGLPERPYRGKRVFDWVVLGTVAVPVALVGSVCAAAIKLSSRGPVFFCQDRVGIDGRTFRLVKFRTMKDVPARRSAYPDPAEITRVGRWFRRLSIDELPQLLNVARGEMSIVGPRPTLAYQVERYTSEQWRRLAVRPGITGLAQVQGRNSLDWAARIQIDLDYLERQSFWLDAKILWWTGRAVLEGSGVEGHPRDDPLAAAPPEACQSPR